jgi:hypothetical protein
MTEHSLAQRTNIAGGPFVKITNVGRQIQHKHNLSVGYASHISGIEHVVALQ